MKDKELAKRLVNAEQLGINATDRNLHFAPPLVLSAARVSAKPGRNDLCYCGSGKKYKKCHLPSDEQARAASISTVSDQPPGPGPLPDQTRQTILRSEEPDWSEAAAARKQLARAIQKARGSSTLDRDSNLRRLLKDNEISLTYLQHEPEIQAASEQLRPFHAEFERLCHDPAAFERQSKALFEDAAFAPFRFTAADLTRAFAEVGSPAPDDFSKKTGKLLRKALLFLATPERRSELAFRLLLLLPTYVRQGRPLDALLIESCARQTAEQMDEPNPFLGRMFLFGMEAWATQQDASRQAVLDEAGFHLGADADAIEIENWLEQQAADPESTARWESVIKAHPELQATPQQAFQLMAREAMKLLDRGDSARLLLGTEEIQPWIPLVYERLQTMMTELGPTEPGAKVPKRRQRQAFDQFYLPLMREIAKGVFTPERIQRLVADLKAYRKALAALGDKQAMLCANSAVSYVEPETEPEMNTFLINLCARSLQNCSAAAAAEPAAGGLDADDGEPAP